MAIQYEKQLTFSSLSFQDIIDPNHKLVKLSSKIDWVEVHGRLRGYYSNVGRQGLPIRLMVGLHILKHMYNMSDEQCVDRIGGDLYWMAFCGVDVERLKGQLQRIK